ncbi:FkbM family methyltransferase [Fluviispira vulneris]|uniref:FkbM family methyltransferase n=1 Tax=Fluviispira vulneris TaxID=2763012 RepID=UPI001645FF34|nr:FkbM family methyltransferase [Fluviispira vulneris]
MSVNYTIIKFIKMPLKLLVTYVVKLAMKVPFYSQKFIRSIIFDNTKNGKILYSNIGNESYLISSNDKVIGKEIFIKGEFELEKFHIALSILKNKNFKAEIIIDIGANIGSICIPAIKRNIFQYAIAFEPEPFNYSLLLANVNLNGLGKRIKTYNCALGAFGKDEALITLSENNYGDHRINYFKNDEYQIEKCESHISIKIEKIDDIITLNEPLNTLIWIDTQGFEGFILKGAEKILRAKPPLVLEFWPQAMEGFSSSYENLKDVVLHSNYEYFYDLEYAEKPIKVSSESLDLLYNELKLNNKFTDLLFV